MQRGRTSPADAAPLWRILPDPIAAPPALINAPYGTIAADTLVAGAGGARLLGYQAGDQIIGGSGADVLFGLMGNDSVHGDAGADALYGGYGDDFSLGGAGNDVIVGGAGTDTLSGDANDDQLFGEDGGDSLQGGDGNDILYGDRGPSSSFIEAAGQEVIARTDAQIGAGDFAIIYQGASYSVAGLSATDHDMIFVNPARVINTGVPNGETLWTTNEVNTIEASGGGKLLIGYLSVGKINDYVSYWNSSWTSNGLASGTPTGSAPAFLGAFDTANTRLVNFWEPAWTNLLIARIDTMVAQGFSGIFLDDILVYFTQRGGSLAQIAQAAREMRDLLTDLAEHAKAVAGSGFAVIVNGAPYLINDGTADGSPLDVAAQTAFYASLDGILIENYFSQGLGAFIAQTVAQYGARDIALLSVDTGQATTQQQEEIEEAAFSAGFLPETTIGTTYSENTPRVVPGAAAAPGNDQISGGAGNDQLHGGGGQNSLIGGTGDDTYFVSSASDTISESANEGYDVLAVGFSYTLAALVSIELITTGWIDGTTAINLTGNEFDNQIWGNAAVNTLTGADGADALFGYGGNDILAGGGGADLLVGGLGADQLTGGLGDDTYILEDTSDTITESAGQGNDVIGVGLSYTLAAGISIELITTGFIGGTASVNLTGNELANQIWGNDGSNFLNGGAGADVLIGFGGGDAFVFSTALGAGNIDTLADFNVSQDVIRLDDAIFTGLALGELSSAAFVIGSAAADGSDRIIYNSTTGALLFDADGTGPTAAVQFAALAGGLSLNFADFLVI